MKQLLEDAKNEIVSLRRDNELMRAKIEVMDLFACVLHTKPAMRSEGAAPDVAWALQKAIDSISEAMTPNAALTGAEGVRVEGTVMQQTEE